MDQLNKIKLNRDVKILIQLISIFCDKKHKSRAKNQWDPQRGTYLNYRSNSPKLCQECSDLLDYSIKQREKCPLDPKPLCKRCKIHCYSSDYRLKIKEVMRYSGMYLVTHGRMDLIFHLFV
ncbi:nitrous oxide-stimulated promoter family protein [[Eubacterium] cellulosolvens]